MFERHFVAYGVRIGLRVDSRALRDTLERDPRHLNLPLGWRAVEDHESDAPESACYDLLTGVSGGASDIRPVFQEFRTSSPTRDD